VDDGTCLILPSYCAPQEKKEKGGEKEKRMSQQRDRLRPHRQAYLSPVPYTRLKAQHVEGKKKKEKEGEMVCLM